MLVGVGAGLAVFVRLLLSGSPSRVVWAEDGAVFFQDAARHPASSLTSAYRGYGHLVARLLAELGHFVPIKNWPILVVATTAVVVGLTSVVVFRAAIALELGILAAVVGALVTALLPGFGSEVLGTWANLQWVLAYGLAWVLLVPPSRSGRFVPSLFALLALGGGVASVFVCPLLLLHGRRWYRHPAVPGLVGGLLYQVVVRLSPSVSVDRHRPASSTSALTFLKLLLKRPGQALVDSSATEACCSSWRSPSQLRSPRGGAPAWRS
jgi:hypothetical protein